MLMTHLCHKPSAEGAEIPQGSISGSPHRLGLLCPDSALWRREGQMRLRRREFIAGLGGAAAWPLAAGAQQGDRVRRIGVLVALSAAILAWWQASLLRSSIQTETLLKLEAKFNDEKFIQYRIRAAKALLAKRYGVRDPDDVFDFFEAVGLFVRRNR